MMQAGSTAPRPKVEGTWNLHRALDGQPLDVFWMASSLFSAVEHAGQDNYGAANTFMEVFCQYRRSLGLPASVLNICAIDGVGFVAENPLARRKAKSQGVYSLGGREFLDFCGADLTIQPPADNVLHSHAPWDAQSVTTTPWSNPAQVLMGLRARPSLARSWAIRPTGPSGDETAAWVCTTTSAPAATTRPALPNSTPLRSLLDMLAEASSETEDEILSDPAVIETLALEAGRKMHDLMLKPNESVHFLSGWRRWGWTRWSRRSCGGGCNRL